MLGFVATLVAGCGATEAPSEENLTRRAAVPKSALGVPDEHGRELANALNNYRAKRGLSPIRWSERLAVVAATHILDLEASAHNMSDPTCNVHSWSNKPYWTGCCYSPQMPDGACMWQKPMEVAGFKGNGFEIAAQSAGALPIEVAVEGWANSHSHNAIILNQDAWANVKWRSLGAAIHGSFAMAWFSDEEDP